MARSPESQPHRRIAGVYDLPVRPVQVGLAESVDYVPVRNSLETHSVAPLARREDTVVTLFQEQQAINALWTNKELRFAEGINKSSPMSKPTSELPYVSIEEKRARAAHLNGALRKDIDEEQLTLEQRIYRTLATDPGLKAAMFIGGDPYHQRETMLELLTKLYKHNEYSYHHSIAVGRASGRLAQAFGFTPEQIAQTQRDGILHDIGKEGVPSWIWDADASIKMTREQVARRETHPTIGDEMLRERGDSVTADGIVIHHQGKTRMQHRRPYTKDGVAMEEQMMLAPYPLFPRYDSYSVHEARGIITAMIDVGNALASQRPYKEPWERQRIRKVFVEDFRQRLFNFAKRRGYDAQRARMFMEGLIETGLDVAEEFALLEVKEKSADGQEKVVIRQKNVNETSVFEEPLLEKQFGA
jgi:hypothetical protein